MHTFCKLTTIISRITLESLECCEDECSDPFSGTTAPLERTHDSVRLPVQELLTSASDRCFGLVVLKFCDFALSA